jgi:predicted NBD/HSP70 family sugar kinase
MFLRKIVAAGTRPVKGVWMADQPTVGTRVLRRINTATVLDAVRRGSAGPVRLTELVELTGLTRPTVTQAVDELVDSGWLRQHAAESSGVGGRPAMRVSLNGRAAPVLGLDVGPHTVTAGIADLAGAQLAVVRRPVRRKGARQLLRVIDEVTAATLAAADLAAGDVAMVAVGTPGIVSGDRILFAPSIPGWTSIDLVEHLRGLFGCPVQVENDANLAALAHERQGTLLAVQWGERLGAGVVIDGRLHRGAGEAGEIGFIRPPGHQAPAESDRGPLERTIGAEAITELARSAAAEQPGSRLDGVEDAAAVFAAAEAGDEVALAVVERVATTFAEAIAPAVLVLSPDAVVIGGGVARAGDVLLAAVRRHLDELTLTPPRVELSDLAEHTVLTGALRMALDHVWRERLAT